MSAFLDPLDVQEITDSEDSTWEVLTAFRYQSDLVGLITVPLGFVTDFASVPRIPFVFEAVGDDANKPAVVHDYLYYSALFPKPTADKVLLEAMAAIGMSGWRRYVIYWGVVLGGFVAWNNHRKNGDPKA